MIDLSKPKVPVKQDCDPEYIDQYLCKCKEYYLEHHHCLGCGIVISSATSKCGECICEIDEL